MNQYHPLPHDHGHGPSFVPHAAVPDHPSSLSSDVPNMYDNQFLAANFGDPSPPPRLGGVGPSVNADNDNDYDNGCDNDKDKHDDTSSLRRDREREGRCADCGAQTHRVVAAKKLPLTVENEVHRGRCLLCHPLPAHVRPRRRRGEDVKDEAEEEEEDEERRRRRESEGRRMEREAWRRRDLLVEQAIRRERERQKRQLQQRGGSALASQRRPFPLPQQQAGLAGLANGYFRRCDSHGANDAGSTAAGSDTSAYSNQSAGQRSYHSAPLAGWGYGVSTAAVHHQVHYSSQPQQQLLESPQYQSRGHIHGLSSRSHPLPLFQGNGDGPPPPLREFVICSPQRQPRLQGPQHLEQLEPIEQPGHHSHCPRRPLNSQISPASTAVSGSSSDSNKTFDASRLRNSTGRALRSNGNGDPANDEIMDDLPAMYRRANHDRRHDILPDFRIPGDSCNYGHYGNQRNDYYGSCRDEDVIFDECDRTRSLMQTAPPHSHSHTPSQHRHPHERSHSHSHYSQRHSPHRSPHRRSSQPRSPSSPTTPSRHSHSPSHTPHENDDQDQDQDICHILSTMRQNPHDIQLQIRSFHSLWVSSYETDNASAIGRVGGIPTVLDVMRLYHDEYLLDDGAAPASTSASTRPAEQQLYRLFSSGIAIVQNLAVTDHNRDLIADHGGIPLVVDVMRTYLRKEEVQISGCMALANLANGRNHDDGGNRNHDTNNGRNHGSGSGSAYERKISIGECGGILAVIQAVECHYEVESVLRAAYRSLRKLGYRPGMTMQGGADAANGGAGRNHDGERGDGRGENGFYENDDDDDAEHEDDAQDCSEGDSSDDVTIHDHDDDDESMESS
mmetsp:Transcript_22685/g.48057  ORF Transcript_22685/g.48057 Transcript_22685/m.48057 type:complete len:842 (-) Transcript_22685:112-2637(-)